MSEEVIEWRWQLVELQAGPRESKTLHLLPILGIYILPTGPTVGAIFKDTALRKQCDVEVICMVYVTESS